MGGSNITSSAYNSSTKAVSISNVTGNIVITATAAAAQSYTNQIPISTDTSGKVYNSTGYKSGYRLGSSGTESELSGMYVTGFIPCKRGDIIRMKNVTFQYGVGTSSNQRLSFYDANKTHLCQTNATGLAGMSYNGQNTSIKGSDGIYTQFTVGDLSGLNTTNTAYFRINGTYIGSDSIITVNEEIK